MSYIIEFPAEWYYRATRTGGVATGDIERATPFATIAAAQTALKEARWLKRDAKRNARIVAKPEG